MYKKKPLNFYLIHIIPHHADNGPINKPYSKLSLESNTVIAMTDQTMWI